MLSPSTPFWSPNGKSIGFVVDGKLKRLDLDRPGGPGEPVTLCAAEQGGAWSRDGTILFSTGELLYRVPDNGGSPKQVTRLDERRREIAHRYPSFLPDGNHFLYEAISAPFSWSRKTIRVGSLDSSDSRILFDSDAQAVFARGHIFFLRDHMLMAQAFNVRSLAVSGEAFRMADRISSVWGLSPFSLTDSGPLVYAAASDTPRDELVWFDRGGNRLTTVTDALTPNFPVYHPQLSPDRGTLALATIGGKFTDIWLYDLSGSRRTRVTFEPGGPMAPVWSPDGRSIAFASMRNGHFDIYRKAIDGTSVEDLLYSDSDDKFPTSWSPDGKFLLFDRIGYKKPNSVWILPISVDRASSKPLALAESASAEERAEFSPDGRWISWDSQESGQREVYLVPFGAKGVSRDGRRQVSASGGDGARWRRDGREIFYRQGRSLVAVTVNNGPHGIQFGEERPLFRSLSILGYDVSADGQRFLLCLRTRQVTSLPLTVVQNWETVLRKF
jgi:Tol biopolymer transport system component